MTFAPLILTAALGVGVVAAAVPAGESDSSIGAPQNPRSARQTRAPDFTMTMLDGRRVTLASLAGKTVVLDFWGTWCPPCRAATPSLVSFANKYSANSSFVMIGVSSDEATDESAVRDYVAKHQMNWMQHLDAPPRLTTQFQIDDFPTYVVIDGGGIVRERLLGWPRAARGSTVPAGTSVLGALEAAVSKSLRGSKAVRRDDVILRQRYVREQKAFVESHQLMAAAAHVPGIAAEVTSRKKAALSGRLHPVINRDALTRVVFGGTGLQAPHP
jgi:thiol-disulfide isomerase/thioredoxin